MDSVTGNSTIDPAAAETTTSTREQLVRLVAVSTIIACITLPQFWRVIGPEWNQGAIALIGLMAILLLRDGDTRGLGLRSRPRFGWRVWCRFTLWIGAGLAVAIAAFVTLHLAMRWPLAVPRIPPSSLLHHALVLCVFAPVVEELVYRSLLTLALRPTLGDGGTIVASGLVFAAVHHLAGNPSPENQIAGFVLAWVYLRSETILVPIAIHAAGNAVAALSHVANWFLFPPLTS